MTGKTGPSWQQVHLFRVSYDGSSVVSLEATAADAADFDRLLEAGQRLREYFRRRMGSDWGCDGVGYQIQKDLLRVTLHRSGVGPRNFARGIRLYRQEVLKLSA